MKQPLQFNKKEKLYIHFMKQALVFDFDVLKIKKIVFDRRWNPLENVQNFSFIHEEFQPFFPCFEYIFNKKVLNLGVEAEQILLKKLKTARLLTFKSRIWLFKQYLKSFIKKIMN
jgi:hypothetical protein